MLLQPVDDRGSLPAFVPLVVLGEVEDRCRAQGGQIAVERLGAVRVDKQQRGVIAGMSPSVF